MPQPLRFSIMLLAFSSITGCMRAPQLDVLIRGGMIIDGTGAPAFPADLGMRADSIVFLGTAPEKWHAQRVVDASGYVVTPGFIDPHTHLENDLNNPERSANTAYLYQGVTTVVYGNDGGGPIEAGQALARLDSLGTGTNTGILVGHNRLRRRVMGQADREPTAGEMEAMESLLARGMEEGALGLSAGLFYSPGHFAKTEEVTALAKVAARYDGVYDVHQRDESSYSIGLEKAVEETVAIAEGSGVRANISHIKALGADVWGMSEHIVEIIEAARRRGARITADQYPYNASSTSFAAALLPRWVFADDPDYRPKLYDEALIPQLKEAIADNIERRGGPESFLLTVPSDTSLKGRRLSEIAASRGLAPERAALEILREGDSKIASFNMQEEDIRYFMRQPWVMTGSDGGEGHPRKYGTYPRKIEKYVLEEHVISLEEMVHRSTLMPALVFGIAGRGRLAPGMKADLIVFRPEDLREKAGFESPAEAAEGMKYVFVNGRLAVENGVYTGVRAGMALRRHALAPFTKKGIRP